MYNSTYIEQVVNRQPYGWVYTDPSTTFHFAFEEVDPFWWVEFGYRNWKLAVYVGFVYIITIFGIQEYMKSRKAFELKWPLFVWNLGLGLFSIMGFIRMLPNFIFILSQPEGFYSSICLKEHGTIAMGYWILMFVLSKYFELGDTLFIVLRKKPLIFLQWYHHFVTMAATWIVAPFMEPVTRWYVLLNYGVHSLMYPYFAFKTVGAKIPRWFSNIITTLQLTQMIIGLLVNMLSVYYQQSGYDCFRHPTSIKAFAFVYGTFIILFGKLFYDAVIATSFQRRGKKES